MAKRRRIQTVMKTASVYIRGETRVSEMKPPPIAVRGLGELVSGEGTAAPNSKSTTVAAKCSCHGENSSCFKCGGTGFYEKRIAPGVVDLLRKAPAWHSEVSFSNDSRGGAYGIRENGRFESSPLEDDYDS